MFETSGYKSRPSFTAQLLAMVSGCFFLSLPFLLAVIAPAFGIGVAHECHKAHICIKNGGMEIGKRK